MTHPDLLEKPPVLVDVGASGGLLGQWKLLASYSIGVAFDADTRDFSVTDSENKGWKKLYSLNRLVAANSSPEVDFYLTTSPHCSSSLKPDSDALKPWAFSRLFDVKRIVQQPAVDLQSALTAIGIDYIDWYKTDTQGADMRIFDALPQKIMENIIIAEFEPGIIDAYIGEDKLHQLMAYMDARPFWVSQMDIKGSQRIDQADLGSLNYLQKRSIESFLKTAPGWCEISYINTFRNDDMTRRGFLLGWCIATIKAEHGFAMHLATLGKSKFESALFDELYDYSRGCLAKGYFRLAARVARKIAKSVFGTWK